MALYTAVVRRASALAGASHASSALKSTAIATLLCSLTGVSVPSLAKEYSAQTVLRASGEYDDNVRLSDDKVSIAGLIVSPELNVGVRTEKLDVRLNTALDFARFDKDEYNSDDQDFVLTSLYDLEYNTFSAFAQLRRDSTRTSEFPDTDDTGALIDPGSGQVGVRATRRETQSFNLAWEHRLTEKQSVELSTSYSKVDHRSDNLNDYDFTNIGAVYKFVLSDRTQLFAHVGVSRFDSDTDRFVLFGFGEIPIDNRLYSANIQSDTYTVTVGLNRVLTEKLSFSIDAGASYVESGIDSSEADVFSAQSGFSILAGLQDDEDTVFKLNSMLEYSGERTTLSLTFNSGTAPSANGYLLFSNRLFSTANYRLSERSDIFARLDLVDDEALGGVVGTRGSSDRTYGAARAGVSHRLTEAWFVEASYRFRAQERDSLEDSAKSNAVFLDVVYKPNSKTWSR